MTKLHSDPCAFFTPCPSWWFTCISWKLFFFFFQIFNPCCDWQCCQTSGWVFLFFFFFLHLITSVPPSVALWIIQDYVVIPFNPHCIKISVKIRQQWSRAPQLWGLKQEHHHHDWAAASIFLFLLVYFFFPSNIVNKMSNRYVFALRKRRWFIPGGESHLQSPWRKTHIYQLVESKANWGRGWIHRKHTASLFPI